MTSRVDAANRLGAQIVQCDECGIAIPRPRAFFTARLSNGLLTGIIDFCSLSCISVSSFRGMDVRAWKPNDRHGHGSCVEIGARSLAFEDKRWVWTDAGDAYWIQENLERLRAAGEDL